MASITMTASLLGSSAASTIITKHRRNGLTVAKASRATEGEKTCMVVKNINGKEESSNGRRELVFAAAAAAAASITKVAMAEEPKPGTPEAKKKYAPVCVTMPTARICKK